MRLQVQLDCPVCKKSYYKAKSEYLRNLKKNRDNYCSLSCSSKATFERNLPKEKRSNYDISQHSKDLIDDYTDFRYVFKLIKGRMHKECKVSLNDLKEIWEYQKGICPYTGIKLKLMKHGYKFQDISKLRFEIASLDRVDSTKGYEKGNLCFVSTMVNFMKNNISVEDTVKFMFIMNKYLESKSEIDIISKVEDITGVRRSS